ncbi:MAG: MDR family MFS transporter [Acidimicrobiales bacterium]
MSTGTLGAKNLGPDPSQPPDHDAGAATDAAAAAEHRRVLVIVGALLLGMLLAALDQTIVATALPTIAADLGGIKELPWVVTAYLLTSTISTPLWGKLGDLFGRKKLFQAAILIFLVGSVLSGISQNMGELVAFRALQGIGGGGLIVGAQAIIGDVVSPRQRGRYQGYFGAVFGLTSVAGPLLGGFFTQNLSWRWVFYVNIPIGIVALFVVGAVLHLPRTRTEHKVDYVGTALLGGAVTAFILLTTWGGTTYPWLSTPVLGLAVLGVVLLMAFCIAENRAEEPLIPLALFRNRIFSATSAIGFIVGFGMFGAIVYIPLYLQTVHGASPTSSGLQLAPLMLGLLSTSIVTGQLITRRGRYKVFPILGTAVMSIGLFLLSRMTPTTPLIESSLFMFILGTGLGGVMQVLVIAVQNAVAYRYLGTATSAATFFRSIGGSFGVAVFGTIFNSRLRTNLPKYLPGQTVKHMGGGSVTLNPAQLKALPPPIHHGVVLAFSHSLQTVFLIGVPVAVVAFGITWLLQEVPLRDKAYLADDVGSPPYDVDSPPPLAVEP